MALTEKRAADRKTMADAIEKLAQEHGAKATRRVRGRCIHIDIEAARGLCAWVEFDGESVQPDIHVIPWYVQGHDALLARSFGDVNPYHFGKATHVAYGFDALREEVARGLRAAADGSAFQPSMYARREPSGMFAMRQARYRGRLTQGREHPDDTCAVARSAAELRAMCEKLWPDADYSQVEGTR